MENRQYNSSALKTLEKNNSRYTVWGIAIIFLIIYILNIINHYDETDVTVQLLYIPILLSVYIFGKKAGVATSIFVGIAARPFIILNSLSSVTQAPLLWVTQTLMFLMAAVIFSIFAKHLKELLKKKSYMSIQTGNFNSNILNLNNIINNSKYRNISYNIIEYKNLKIINKHINLGLGKKTYKLIIVNKYDSSENFNEFSDEIAY